MSFYIFYTKTDSARQFVTFIFFVGLFFQSNDVLFHKILRLMISNQWYSTDILHKILIGQNMCFLVFIFLFSIDNYVPIKLIYNFVRYKLRKHIEECATDTIYRF